jgi:hypothetical protein
MMNRFQTLLSKFNLRRNSEGMTIFIMNLPSKLNNEFAQTHLGGAVQVVPITPTLEAPGLSA